MDLLITFKQYNALLDGHFLLSSGLHSNRYMQSALILQHPDVATQLGKLLGDKFEKVDVVVSPAIGGIVIGQEVAKAKGCRAIFVEKDDTGKPAMRRGFQLEKGEKALIIEDVITTGLSTNEVAELVNSLGAEIAGIGSIVNRGGASSPKLLKWGKPIHSLLNVDVKSWPADDCELCKKGQPVVKPGSRKAAVH